MFRQRYKIANQIFSISTKEIFFHNEAKCYLTHYKAQYKIEILEEDVNCEKEKGESSFSYGYYEYLAVLRKMMEILIPLGYFLIHGSAISIDNKGYIFIAKSGMGKTTHTDHYQSIFKDRFKYINGDKPFIKFDELKQCFLIYGNPWCGKEKHGTNIEAPLNAIISLNRGETNFIKEVKLFDIYQTVYEQIYKTNNNGPEIIELMDLVNKYIQFFDLKCTKDRSAAICSYKGINKTLSFEDVLAFDNKLTYTTVGDSMYPLIKSNEDICTIEVQTPPFKKFDVILFKRSDGTYVLHRIIKVNRNGTYNVLGDNRLTVEKGIKDSQILGVLKSINKKQEIISIKDEKYQKYLESIKRRKWFYRLQNRVKRKIVHGSK